MKPIRLIRNLILAAACICSPVSLAATIDGTPSYNPATDTGLLVWRTSSGNFKARLLSGTSSPQEFKGVFQATQAFSSFSRKSIETKDTVVLTQPDTLKTELKVWPSSYDGVDFTLAGSAGICLRSTSGAQVTVRLGVNKVARTTPVDLTGNGACSTAPPPTTGRKFNTGHYISLLRKNASQSVMANSIKPGVVGFKKRYTWRQLEPTQGNYDFSEVASDLNFAASQGMQLIVLIEDKTFTSEKPTPAYLQGTTYTRANRAGGYTAVRWNPFVVTRMKALVTALGQRFDSHPSFEGMATQETAPGFAGTILDATGYTPEKYRDALIDILKTAANNMPNSRVFWFMNFFPRRQGYIADVATALIPHGVVMGGPDIMPDDEALVRHTYPFYYDFADKMPLFGQVEPICYAHPHADTSYPTKYWTMGELFRFGRDRLKVKYIFWVRLPKSDYFNSYNWNDALPVIANNPSFNP